MKNNSTVSQQSEVGKDGKTVLTLIDRRPGAVVAGAAAPVHKNNAINIKAAVYMLGGIGVIVIVILMLGGFALYGINPPKPNFVNGLSVSPVASGTSAPAVTALATRNPPVVNPVIVVTVVVPTPRVSPVGTAVPVVVPTGVPDVVLSLSVYWPVRNVANAKTITGVPLTAIEGVAGACAEEFPLGTVFKLASRMGANLLCADRDNTHCLGAVCPFVLYSNKPESMALVGLQPAWVNLPVRVYGLPTP